MIPLPLPHLRLLNDSKLGVLRGGAWFAQVGVLRWVAQELGFRNGLGRIITLQSFRETKIKWTRETKIK